MENTLNLFEKSIIENFNEFDRGNPQVYKMFERFALELINTGAKIVPHVLIIQRMRWENYFITTDENSTFKINNNYSAHYGRKFCRKFPEHFHLFRFRGLTTL